jgi:hypothetical protein
MLNNKMKRMRVNESSSVNETELKEIFNKYLDDNQQSGGHRKRLFLGWYFRVSANNRIIDLQ